MQHRASPLVAGPVLPCCIFPSYYNQKIMKKNLLTLVAALLICFTATAQTSGEEPRLDNPHDWTVIVIPDTQGYSKNSQSQPICDLMMAWVAAHIDSLNVKMVLHTGDLVEHDTRALVKGYSGDQTAAQQWAFIARSFGKLDGRVPYLTAAGNHDYTYDYQTGGKTTHFSQYFTADKNPLNARLLCQVMTDEKGEPSLDNAAYEWTSPAGRPYLFMTLEYGPRDTVVNWAKRIVAMPRYRDHRVVLLTHAYLDDKSQRLNEAVSMSAYQPVVSDGEALRTRPVLKDANNGEELFKKLVYPSTNIELVVCGHIAGFGFRQDKNAAGRTVNQMLYDMQCADGGYEGNGGDGWLRVLEFSPDEQTVRVKTFSPLFFVSQQTRALSRRTDAGNDFEFHFSR